MNKSSGKIATANGRNLEQFTEDLLKRRHYNFIETKKFIATSKASAQCFYTKQFNIGKTIYDTSRKCDFIIYCPKNHPNFLVIECKWQQSKGSVDEKYPYLIENIKISPYRTIILVDGKGYKPKALEWLKKQTNDKLIGVFSMMEFQLWVNKENI